MTDLDVHDDVEEVGRKPSSAVDQLMDELDEATPYYARVWSADRVPNHAKRFDRCCWLSIPSLYGVFLVVYALFAFYLCSD